MLGLFVLLGKERTKRMTFKASTISIGADANNDLILRDGGVAADHVKIELDEQEDWHLTFGAPVVIAGRTHEPSHTKLRVNNGTRIGLGSYTLQLALEPELSLDPVEQRLLAEIAARDDDARLVYADWLEEKGHAIRAEFLRTQFAIFEPSPDLSESERDALPTKLRALADQVDEAWRRKVARPLIENCDVGIDLACAKDWGSLVRTKDPKVRSCETCKERVHYAGSIEEARDHTYNNHCVVVDLRLVRHPNDLRPMPPMAGRMVVIPK